LGGDGASEVGEMSEASETGDRGEAMADDVEEMRGAKGGRCTAE
jgi:hypothetical protein